MKKIYKDFTEGQNRLQKKNIVKNAPLRPKNGPPAPMPQKTQTQEPSQPPTPAEPKSNNGG